MRTDQRALRIAIATLYLRQRDARRRKIETQGWAAGPLHQAAIAEETALHNAIRAIQENICANHASMPTSKFIPMVAKVAHIRQRGPAPSHIAI